MSVIDASAATFELNGVPVVDTFAEAFPMTASRLIITADSATWAEIAAQEMSGYATSVIACDAEVAVERRLDPADTPDGRPGVSVLAFAFSRDALAQALAGRVGQCVLTCPTTACFDGLPDVPQEKQISVGGAIRYFGDGFQISKKLGGKRYWRIPVMDGEFLCQDKFGTVSGVGGGNLIVCGQDVLSALAAAEAAVAAVRQLPDVALPFPGGVVRSGSKVGSQYKKLKASTNDAYCPTVRPLVKSALPSDCGAAYEIVVDGLSADAVRHAMRVGLHAAVQVRGVVQVTAGNYGGKLGKYHFPLRELV